VESADALKYMKQARRWVCAVARQLDEESFLITTYPTDAIKEGVKIWPR